MRRHSLLVAFVIFAACGEPYEGEIPNTEAPARDGGVDEAASDAFVDATDSAADAAPDANVDPCSDRDKDGVLAKGCDGGTDCDDDDNRAFPDAGFVKDEPTLVTKGDWNCDGTFSVQHAVNVKCSDHTSDGLGGGCAFEGFKGAPACGKTGDYVKCKTGGLFGSPCVEETVSQLVQGCK